MIVVFSSTALEDLQFLIKTKARVAARVLGLIDSIRRDPFRGPGKPEPLKHWLKGSWSRRIDDEHRLVYRVTGSGENQTLEIAACRNHYKR